MDWAKFFRYLIFGIDSETRAKFPYVFEQTKIDRRKCHRVVPMKVICPGMGRTGTATMKSAMEILGFPCGHGFDQHSNPLDCVMWNEAYEAKYHKHDTSSLDRTFWDHLLGHLSAVTDYPSNSFAEELIEAYPDAKVVLVERDVDRWYESYEEQVLSSFELPGLNFIAKTDPQGKGLLITMGLRGLMQGHFGSKDPKEWRLKAKTVYKEHYQAVRDLMKAQPERLLEFQLSDGWEPLCKFLGVGIPDAPFPRANERAIHDEMRCVAYAHWIRLILVPFTLFAVPAIVAAIVFLR